MKKIEAAFEAMLASYEESNTGVVIPRLMRRQDTVDLLETPELSPDEAAFINRWKYTHLGVLEAKLLGLKKTPNGVSKNFEELKQSLIEAGLDAPTSKGALNAAFDLVPKSFLPETLGFSCFLIPEDFDSADGNLAHWAMGALISGGLLEERKCADLLLGFIVEQVNVVRRIMGAPDDDGYDSALSNLVDLYRTKQWSPSPQLLDFALENDFNFPLIEMGIELGHDYGSNRTTRTSRTKCFNIPNGVELNMAQDILLKMYGSNPELFGQSTGWAQRSICALIEKCGVNPHERTGGAPSAIELISLVGKADFTDAALKANACREAGELEVLMIKAASSAQKRRRSL